MTALVLSGNSLQKLSLVSHVQNIQQACFVHDIQRLVILAVGPSLLCLITNWLSTEAI